MSTHSDLKATARRFLLDVSVGAYLVPSNVVLLTSPTSQVKMVKGIKKGVLTWVLQLSPHTESGRNMCPWAGFCAKSCIAGAGQNAMSPARNARLWRTALFHGKRPLFGALLRAEIVKAIDHARRKSMVPAFRLNGLSDVDWTQMADWIDGMGGLAYDYTKSIVRAQRVLDSGSAYHLTYSWSERSKGECVQVADFMTDGGTMAVVFSTKKGEALPLLFRGHPVIDGDQDDVRFDDAPGVVVALRFKAAKDIDRKREEAIEAGFCVRA